MIPFTQFVLPDGRQKPITIDRSPEIEAKARELISKGYVFEAEILRTGEISLECLNHELEHSAAMEIAPNGPAVPPAVDKLVMDAFEAALTPPENEPQ